MASSAKSGHGTLLQRASTEYPGDSGYATIAEITSDLTHAMSADVIDTTHHGSGGFEDKNQGIKRIDETPIEGNWLNDATQDADTGLLAQFLAGTKFNYQMILPNSGGTFKWHGFLKDFRITGQLKGVQKFSATLVPSGPHTDAP